MAMEVKLLQPVKVVCTDDLGETLVDIMQTAGYSRPLMVTGFLRRKHAAGRCRTYQA